MNVAGSTARERFAAAPSARLATADARGVPHLVPITFALVGSDQLVFAVDHKPKRTTALKRLANIAENPRVSVLVDGYEDDWSTLWWARADGTAVVFGAGRPEHVAALVERYPQYRERPPRGAVVVITVQRWSGWSASAQ